MERRSRTLTRSFSVLVAVFVALAVLLGPQVARSARLSAGTSTLVLNVVPRKPVSLAKRAPRLTSCSTNCMNYGLYQLLRQRLKTAVHGRGTLEYVELTDSRTGFALEAIALDVAPSGPTGVGYTDYVHGTVVVSAHVRWTKISREVYRLSYLSSGAPQVLLQFTAKSSKTVGVQVLRPTALSLTAVARHLRLRDSLTAFFRGRVSPLRSDLPESPAPVTTPVPTPGPGPTILPVSLPCGQNGQPALVPPPSPSENLRAWLDGTMTVPDAAHFTTSGGPSRFGYVSEAQAGRLAWYHGLFLGADAFGCYAVIYLGFEDGGGHRYYLPFLLQARADDPGSDVWVHFGSDASLDNLPGSFTGVSLQSALTTLQGQALQDGVLAESCLTPSAPGDVSCPSAWLDQEGATASQVSDFVSQASGAPDYRTLAVPAIANMEVAKFDPSRLPVAQFIGLKPSLHPGVTTPFFDPDYGGGNWNLPGNWSSTATYPGGGTALLAVAHLARVASTGGRLLINLNFFDGAGRQHPVTALVFDSQYPAPGYLTLQGTTPLHELDAGGTRFLRPYVGQWILLLMETSPIAFGDGSKPWYAAAAEHLEGDSLPCNRELAAAVASGFPREISCTPYVAQIDVSRVLTAAVLERAGAAVSRHAASDPWHQDRGR